MEGLSAPSSIVSVVSLAFQIGASIQKLCDFWELVEDGPRGIRNILTDLHVVSNVLEDIRCDTNHLKPHSRALNACLIALEGCRESVEALGAIVNGLHPGFSSQAGPVKKFTALKIAWKADKIRRFQESLRDMKTTLTLARLNYMDCAARAREEDQKHELSVITEGLRILLQEPDSSTVTTRSTDSVDVGLHLNALRQYSQRAAAAMQNPVTRIDFERLIEAAISRVSDDLGSSIGVCEMDTPEPIPPKPIQPRLLTRERRKAVRRRCFLSTSSTLYGTLHIASTVSEVFPDDTVTNREQELGDYGAEVEIRTVFNVHPSRWLLFCGLNFGIQITLSKSLQGFDYRFKSYRAVPNDALIFKLSEKGETTAIQSLFDERKASPWDTNSRGLTPLFFAARFRKLDTCKLLITQGADLEARSLSNDTVASYACMTVPDHPTSCKTHIDVLRLFLDSLEFEDDINCTGLLGLRRLLSNSSRCYDTSCSHSLAHPETFYWALNIFQKNISARIPSMGRGIALMLLSAMEADDIELLERLIVLSENINSKQVVRWFSLGHYLALKMGTRGLRESTPVLVSRGLNLHILADDDYRGSQVEICRNDSPTSLIMRYSHSFFLLRNLLRDLNMSLQEFVQDELEQGPLRKQGWTFERLLELFELDFKPFKMPIIQCHGRSQRATETSWRTALERLKSRPDGFKDAAKILQARDKDILSGSDIRRTICGFCSESALKSTQNSVDDNSPFLLVL